MMGENDNPTLGFIPPNGLYLAIQPINVGLV